MYLEKTRNELDNKVNISIRTLIGDFSILWNLYEKDFLKKAGEIYKENLELETNETITIYQENKHSVLLDLLRDKDFFNQYLYGIDKCFEALIVYMKKNCTEFSPDRFSANDVIDYFHVGKSDGERREVKELFIRSRNNDWKTEDKLHLLLIVIWRVRNNMFHGIKAITTLEDEEELFLICNDILAMILNPISEHINKYTK